MNGKVLVGYATRTGATGEVAEAVALALREQGVEVDVQLLRQVRSLDGYRAVVLGAPLYFGKLLGDARRFFARERAALTALPVAVFALGAATTKPEEQQGAQGSFDAEMARLPWLKPVSTSVFGSRWDPELLRFPFSLLKGALKSQPNSDARDWDAIRAWAESLPSLLRGKEI
ncbi:MAG: flavodoxin domain-containing protein [Anaerolineae bacterium]